MTDCPKCGMRDDDWFLCRDVDCSQSQYAEITRLTEALGEVTKENATLRIDVAKLDDVVNALDIANTEDDPATCVVEIIGHVGALKDALTAAQATIAKMRGFDVINPRRLFNDDPNGYYESDMEYVSNNMDACVRFLDAALASPAEKEG